MSAKVTVTWVIPAGYSPGDYARLCGNGGSGSVDYDTPVNEAKFDLFANGGGIFGFGYAPFGQHRFGRAHSSRTLGFGLLPFGKSPFGYGSRQIAATDLVDECGEYKYAFACYDSLGNIHAGTPEEETVYIHIAPEAPAGLVPQSYDKAADILILSAA